MIFKNISPVFKFLITNSTIDSQLEQYKDNKYFNISLLIWIKNANTWKTRILRLKK